MPEILHVTDWRSYEIARDRMRQSAFHHREFPGPYMFHLVLYDGTKIYGEEGWLNDLVRIDRQRRGR